MFASNQLTLPPLAGAVTPACCRVGRDAAACVFEPRDRARADVSGEWARPLRNVWPRTCNEQISLLFFSYACVRTTHKRRVCLCLAGEGNCPRLRENWIGQLGIACTSAQWSEQAHVCVSARNEYAYALSLSISLSL